MILSIITIPMATSIAIFLFGRYLGQKGSVLLSIISIVISMVGGIRLLYRYLKNNEEITINIYNWINTGMLNIPINLYYDKYSILMVFLITTITFVVITYSTWYMYEDPHKNRFLSILLMFAVTMLILVSSSNFFLMFVGWEGVGIMSYLLINFWYFSINSNKSAIKAILYNKIGDIGFLITISLITLLFSNATLKIAGLGELSQDTCVTLLLLGACAASIAKSAQIFLHPWLGDAMAGPTPVSALLHAATMVTAGVYLLFRLDSLIMEDATEKGGMVSTIIIIVGLLTIIFGGLSSINQNDIKKIIAYSTCSQLGYMFLTNGLLIPNVGLFHLLTHGFFKAMLFLTAGIIIHNCANHEQDIRKFGSFIFYYPMSFFLFSLGSLSILSFPFLSGFYSKEAIIESSLSPQFPIYIYILMILGAVFTSIYSFKLIYYTFLCKPNFTLHPPNLQSSAIGRGEFPLSLAQLPLAFGMIILVLGSIFFGYFTKEIVAPFMGGDNEFFPFYIKLIPLFFSLSGIFLAFVIINPWKYRAILTVFNKRFFFDSLVNYFFAFKILTLGYLYTFKLIDRGLLESTPLGGIGLMRILFSIPFYYNRPPTAQYDTLFVYLFLTFLLLVLFFIW